MNRKIANANIRRTFHSHCSAPANNGRAVDPSEDFARRQARLPSGCRLGDAYRRFSARMEGGVQSGTSSAERPASPVNVRFRGEQISLAVWGKRELFFVLRSKIATLTRMRVGMRLCLPERFRRLSAPTLPCGAAVSPRWRLAPLFWNRSARPCDVFAAPRDPKTTPNRS